MKRRRRCPYNILVAAGPTREFIDPVRFITNSSTGTIGYCISEEARKRRHNVVLLSGHTHRPAPAKVKKLYFNTAEELKSLTDKYFPWADCFICSAAVADFRPLDINRHKIKKNKRMRTLKLIRTPDILAGLGKHKGEKVLVGFALETDNLLKNSREKLKKKNLDFIIANKLSKNSVPFGDKEVNVFLINGKKAAKYTKISKEKLSRIILDSIEDLCYIQKRSKKEEIYGKKKKSVYAY